jgi:uncharacterized RmlC-like cupin family protein
MNETSLACQHIRARSTYQGKQGLSYLFGISKETVGAQGICMHVLTMPPGARAKPHLHEHHETAIYVLSGQIDAWYGEQLEHHVAAKAGDMFYIPAGVPHMPANLTDTPASAIVSRTDPNEQESVLLLPHLDADMATEAPPKRGARTFRHCPGGGSSPIRRPDSTTLSHDKTVAGVRRA